MTPLEIQFELKKRNITQRAIAEELGVTDNHVSSVIRKLRTSERVMRAIAGKIGRHHWEVFPEHYLNSNRKAA